MLRLDDLAVFVATAERGSLSAAARDLDMSPALASVALKRLESALGIRLVARTTRSLRLTEEGEHYLVHAREAVRLLKQGHQALMQGRDDFAGTLKISMPSDLGRNVLTSWLDGFQQRYPRMQYQLNVSDRLSDLYRQPVDMAIRYGKQEDSNLIAFALAPDNRRALVASPAYIAAHGEPRSLDELRQHNCLRFAIDDVIHTRWTFQPAGGGAMAAVHVSGNRSADDADVVRRWAVAGLGIAYKSRPDVCEDLDAGRLHILLPDHAGEAAPLYMLCMHRAQVTPVVLQLRDYLREQCALRGACVR